MLSTTPRRRPRLPRPLIAVALLATVAGSPMAATATASAQAGPFHSITVAPQTGLVDGQTIEVTLHATDASYSFAPKGRLRICRDGVDYTRTEDLDPAQGNCPIIPLSSSGTTTPNIFAFPNGTTAIASMQVGTGTVVWGPTAADPSAFSLTCDVTSPCRLVVDITDARGLRRIVDASTLLTFSADSAVSACGGSEADVVSTAGPDRMGGAWIGLTRAKCAAQPGTRATTKGVFAGEGEGQASFARGLSDLTYSGVGPTFPGDTATRASVSVPFALNATVIGVLGGYPKFADDWPLDIPRPFENLQATWSEMASLFGSEPFLFTITYEDALKARNPELAISPAMNTAKSVPLAPAGAESVTWFATEAFHDLAATDWVSPPNPVSGNVPSTRRGVHESFATAQPPFAVSYIELYSGQGQLKKVAANQFLPQTYGPIWVLTDLATARELDIPTVALPNASGRFVQPTEDSLLAAVDDLQLQADGTYLPGPITAPDAYPLMFVEHGVAPTEPLLDSTCTARTGVQQQLTSWLAFLTGDGQRSLPAGLVALPPAMADQAARARTLVGAAAVTGPCAPTAPTDPDPDPDPGFAAGGSAPGGNLPPIDALFGGTGGAGSSGGPSASGSSPGAGPTGAMGSDVGDDGAGVADDGGLDGDGSVAIAEIAYPDPTSGSGSNPVATAFALVVLAVLAAVGGVLSSGRRRATPGRARP